MSSLSETWQKLKPYVVGLINSMGGGSGPYAPDPHALDGSSHSATTDNTTLDATILLHGLMPKADKIAMTAMQALGLHNLTDPNADRIMFWDDSAGATAWLAPSTGLAISTTNLTLSHLGIEALTDPAADRVMFWDDSAGVVTWMTMGASLSISGTTLRRAALTGDVTAAVNSNATTIADGVVTYAKMQDVSATDRLLGRDTALAGDVEELTVGGGIEFTGAGGIQTSAFTGDVTKSAGGTALTIANDAVTYAKMQNVSATDKVLGRSSAGSGDVEEIACTTAGRALIDDATAADQRTTLGLGTMATETATNYVAKSLYDAYTVLYADTDNTPAALTLAASNILGRGSAGGIAALTVSAPITISGTAVGHSTADGYVHTPSGGAAAQLLQYSSAGTAKWITVSNDVTIADGGAVTIAAQKVTVAKMYVSATDKILGRDTAGAGAAEELGVTGAITITGGNVAHSTADGYVHTPSGGSAAQILQYSSAGTAKWITVGTDVTIADGGAVTIANGAVSLAKMANMATASLIYRKTAGSGAPEVNSLATLKTDLGLTGTNSGDQTITLTGDVTGSGTGSFATTIAAQAVAVAEMYVSATDKLLGRDTAGAGAAEELGVSSPLSITGGNLTHLATAGNIHLPASGSSNQILKNSGVAGTGAWGTVTENSGALANVTTISMSGQLTNTLATGTAPMAITSTTRVSNLNVAQAGVADTVTVADAGGDSTTWVMLATAATGNLAPATDAGITYNATSNTLSTTAISISGQLTSTLATGTAPLVIASTTQVANLNVARAGLADTVTVADAGADTTTWVMLATAATGNLAPATDAGLAYNASTNVLTVSGNVIAGSGGGAYGSAATGTLSINVTATKTLTLTSADTYTLTVPATGTAALLATANVFTASQSLTAEAAYNPQLTMTNAYAGTAAGYLKLQKARGSIATPGVISSGDTLGNINFYGHDGSNYTVGFALTVAALAAPGAGVVQGRMQFFPYNSSGAAVETLRMSATEVRFNEAGSSAVDFYVESDTYDAITVDASNDSILLMSNLLGKIGFFGTTPTARPSPAGDAITAPTYTAPGSPDYAWAGGTNSSAWGFTSQAEFETMAKVLADLVNGYNALKSSLGSSAGLGLVGTTF